MVNFLWNLLNHFNWNLLGDRDESDFDDTAPKNLLCQGNIFKLHGDMEHELRKHNYFGFDKAENAVFICTDVASRGLDFKNVQWII
jgi:ATP-dependent RNA helicase DDX31/DBP7